MLKKVVCSIVIALSVILTGSVRADDTLWSVDIQGAGSSGFGQLDPPVLMGGIEPLYGYGNIWNAFNVPGHDLPALVDPSMQLVDSQGKATGVAFNIFGNISGFSYGNVIPLAQDYLFVNAGNSDASVSWSITGLKAGSTYELYAYGGGVVGRDIGLTVDEDGDGDLSNNQAENVPADGHLFMVRASAKGSVIGDAAPGTAGEGNWSGFQLKGAYQIETSSGPSPESEAADVLRDVLLTWMPGEFAQTHHVYFGASLADVESASPDNPLGVLVSQNQDANSFDPGRLEFGQTYYWRVDEVNGAPDKTVFKGDVWHFTAEPYSISIPGSTIVATASSQSNEFSTPDKTIDGSGFVNGAHAISPETMWFTAAVDLDPWIQYEFDAVKKLDTMTVWNSNSTAEMAIGWGVKDVQIDYSVDGENWHTLEGATQFSRAPGLPTYAQYDEIEFGGAAAKVVRLNIQSNWGGILTAYGLSEVQFSMIPARAREPMPASGAVEITPNSVITWRAGRDVGHHTIYLSPDQSAVADGSASSVSSNTNSLDLGSLDLALGETYYWRVDEVNEAEATPVWAGPMWDFTTPAVLTVDEFERYTNDSPNRPFQTWLDGFGYSADEHFPVAYPGNGTGSGVGHDIWSLSSPHYNGQIMEEAIVKSGSLSLPFYYNNTGGAASEIDHKWAQPQDWSAYGIQSLVVNFNGDRANTGTSLYVKINGETVTYPDQAALSYGLWIQWVIDLSSLNIDLKNVTQLTLGVEGVGTGVIYIDAIQLNPNAAEYVQPVAPDTASLVGYYALDGDATDDSGQGVHGIQNGAPIYDAGVMGDAVRLNGIDDFIDLGVPTQWPAGAAPRSVCAWAQTFSVEPGWRVIASYGSPATPQATGLVMNGTSLYASGYGSDISLDNFWDTDEWHHVGLTYDGTTVRLYADGFEVASGQRGWNTVITVARIGRQVNEANEFWDGRIDEVRVYDQALSLAEMAWLGGKTDPVITPF